MLYLFSQNVNYFSMYNYIVLCVCYILIQLRHFIYKLIFESTVSVFCLKLRPIGSPKIPDLVICGFSSFHKTRHLTFSFKSFYQFFKVSKQKTIQNNTRQFKTIQGNSRQLKTIQGNSRQFKTIQDSTVQGNSRQFKTVQDNSRQFKAIQGNSIGGDNTYLL